MLVLFPVSSTAQSQAAAVPELLKEAARALEQGDLDAAEAKLEAATRAAPEAAAPWLGLAEVAERRGRYEEALERARQAQRLAPREARVALTIGRLLTRVGAVDEALAALERARVENPALAEAWSLGALLLRDQGRHEAAAELLARGLEEVPDPRVLARDLGFLYLALGRGAEAAALVERYLTADDDASSLVLRGLVLAGEPERRDEAIALLERALESGAPREPQLRLDLAGLLLEAGRADEAVAQLRLADRALPDAPEVQYRLALALRAAGDEEAASAALAAYRERQRLFEERDREAKDLGIALNEARDLANANRLEEALARCDEILERGGERAAVLTLRAKVLASLRRTDEALLDVRRAAALEPGSVELPYLEGVFLFQLRQPEAAERALRRALALDPELGEAHRLLGGIAAAGGRWPEALLHLQQAKDAGLGSADLDRLLDEARRRVEAGDAPSGPGGETEGG